MNLVGQPIADIGTRLITSDVAWNRFREELAREPSDLRLLAEAAATARNAPRLTVVDKSVPPPSGDLHDYASQAPYWWPDPSMPGGLPYLRRDGEVNPEFYGTDQERLQTLCDRVTTLILHACATGDEESARAAGKALRVWFLDEETRMNPNLQHAQRIPGRCDGRGIGIIDTVGLCFLLDAVGRLPFNDGWTPDDVEGLKAWFSAYLDWLLTSGHGRDECGEHNNHGTWYDAQVACFALFCGRGEIAREQIERFTRNRLSAQIAEDGSQPHELARTLSLSYCTYNLTGFAVLARLGSRCGLELWRWRNERGADLVGAIRWMIPFYQNQQAWTWPQIGPFNPGSAALLLGLAADGTGESDIDAAAKGAARHAWEGISNWTAGLRKA